MAVGEPKLRVSSKPTRARSAQPGQAPLPPSSNPPVPPVLPAVPLASTSSATVSSTPTSSSALSASLSSSPSMGSDNDTPTPAVPQKRAVLKPTSATEPALRAPSPGAMSSSSASSGATVHRPRSRRRREEPSGLFSAATDEAPLAEGGDTEGNVEPATQDLLDSASTPAVAAPSAPPSTSAAPIGGTSSTSLDVAPGQLGSSSWLPNLMRDYALQSEQLNAAAARVAELERHVVELKRSVAEHERRELELLARVEALEREAAPTARVGQTVQQGGLGGRRGERGVEEGGGGGPSAHAALSHASSGSGRPAVRTAAPASRPGEGLRRMGGVKVEMGDDSHLVILPPRAPAVLVRPSASEAEEVGEPVRWSQGASRGSSQGREASRSSSGVETIVVSDSEDGSRDVGLDSLVVVASSRSPVGATPYPHRSSLSPGIFDSPDTPSPVRNMSNIPGGTSAHLSPASDISIVSAGPAGGDYTNDDVHVAVDNDQSASYDASESVASAVGDGSGGSSFEESQVASLGSTGTAIYRNDVESDWSLRTDSQFVPSQAPQPSQLPIGPATAATTPIATSSSSRGLVPPPPSYFADDLANLSLDPHVDEAEQTQESLQVRAPGAWPANSSSDEEPSLYLDALETQTPSS
ncbi:hypothetical protein JCM8208_006519 [Rhodotorula glutinis]